MISPKLISRLALAFVVAFLSSCAGPGGSSSASKKEVPPPVTVDPPRRPTLSESSDPGTILKNYKNASVVMTGDTIGDLAGPVRHYSDSVTALKLRYVRTTANDCSGTFVRLNQYLKTRMPFYEFPSFKGEPNVRTTKDLVQYYHDKGTLVFVKDPLQSDSLIRPGSVMFYSNSGIVKPNANANNMKSLVQHVGVVTEVDLDSAGRVTRYTLFHGKNSREGIGITDDHFREVPYRSSKAWPYGWFKQAVMAIAPIVSNDSSSITAVTERRDRIIATRLEKAKADSAAQANAPAETK
ncbi:MAG: hypothetical protein AAFY71_21225 [Bacteroidota bacterium]